MITVTGSLAFDTILDFDGKFGDHIMPDKIHQINLSFLVQSLKKQNGSSSPLNLELPSKLLGAVRLAGLTTDEAGHFYLLIKRAPAE